MGNSVQIILIPLGETQLSILTLLLEYEKN
jgi:hypothetical protein